MPEPKETFAGQWVVVTGAASGIGEAVSRSMSQRGAQLVLWDRDAAPLQSLASDIGARHHVLDITEEDQVKTAMQALERCDVLVHSAGIAGPAAPAIEYDYAEWSAVIDVNLKGSFLVNRAALQMMAAQGYGRIVNLASIAGKEGNPNASAYSASKAGLIGLTKSLGKEHADADIAVNCITPAAARTPILNQVSQDFIDFMLSKIPRGRFLELDEVVAMITWLASRENSFSTGAVFDISGGRATY